MSLENLAKIGKLKQHSATREDAAKLLAAARRNLAETRIKELSPETRFDLAYKAVMQCGLLAIMANGYRPSTNEPGHHATVIQTLPVSIGLENDRMVFLDKLRRTRNLNDYSGDVAVRSEPTVTLRRTRRLLTAR
jgi:hypothetical protein